MISGSRSWLGAAAALVVLSPGVLRADPVTILDLYNRAHKDSPIVAASVAGHDAARYGVSDAWFGLLPRASVVHERQRVRQEVLQTENPVYQTGVGRYKNSGRTLEVVQPIFDARNFAQLEAAYAASHRAKYSVVGTEQKVIYSAIESYLLTLAALDSYRLGAAEERALRGHASEVSARLHKGLANDSELDEVLARSERARAQTIASAAAVGEAFAAVRRIGDFEVDTLYPLRNGFAMPTPIPANVNAWIETSRRENPEIKSMESAADEARATYHKAAGAVLPRVELRYYDNFLDSGGSLYGGGAVTDEKNVSLRLTIPLFNPDNQGYPVFAAHAKWKEARYTTEDRRRAIEEKIRTAFIEVVSNAARAQAMAKSAEHQGRLVTAMRQKFAAGLGTVTAILDAERDFFRAQRELLSSRYNYLLNLMLLKQLGGVISTQDVLYINALLDTKHVAAATYVTR